MIRFSADILDAMHSVTRDLEVSLGPETSDLDLRIGIHSGPVTAGVLRGERARLQLFGDTMNTTSRIESSSRPGRIHLSNETAELIIAAGKGHWIEKRENMVEAKGKGALQVCMKNSVSCCW
jgi:class 3 adenylate cyclase